MLKFLRKYQLILLAVGGSLLMVVFLLQPVLQQLTPDPRKEKIATIGETTITMGDQIVANSELEVLERFLPELIPLMGLDDEANRTAHWILLKHEAERLGVMGVQTDGADWIEELAMFLAQRDLIRLQQMGQQITNEFAQQYAEQALQALVIRRQTLLQANRSLASGGFDRVLSTARGVMRLRQLYNTAPQMSRQRAVEALVDTETRVLTDQVVLGADLMQNEVSEPTDAEIAAFFAEYRGNTPGNTDEDAGGNPFGFGYTLPARVKLEWLALDRVGVQAAVRADPVAVRRRWQRENPDGGDFDADRAAIEEQIRSETVDRVMTDADEVIRGEILAATRGLEKEGIYRVVPEGWNAPDLERIAQDVVSSIQERHGVRIPLPTVTRRTDAWQTPRDLQAVPGLGRAAFRVGNQVVPAAQIPLLVRGVGEESRVPVQVGLPIIDPPAEGADGSKYYITVLASREQSPPDSVDEIRAQVAGDLKAKRAYELLVSQLDAYREAAVSGGLEQVAALFPGEGDASRVTVKENIFVSRDRMQQATFESFPDPRADREPFREAVMAKAAGLDPLSAPDSLSGEDAIAAAAMPSARAVAIARIRAKRPPAVEDFRRLQSNVVAAEVRRMLNDAEGAADPLSFASLSDRLGYESLRAKNADDEDAAG